MIYDNQIFIFINSQMSQKDINLMQKLIQQLSHQQIHSQEEPSDETEEKPGCGPEFTMHMLMKVIVLGLFIMRTALNLIFSSLLINELIAIFIVIDFWLTKNVIGKKMIGVRWFFSNDEYGTEKFMFECRANDEYVGDVAPKLFWIVLLIYAVLPFIAIVLSFLMIPLLTVDLSSILISLGILLGGGSNLFFFYKANIGSLAKRRELKKKLGVDLLRQLKLASITSYV